MLIADRDGHTRFVTQPAHAAVAGQFAEHWGGAFDPPTPRAAVVAATHNHDNGWRAYDDQPHAADGELVDFRGVPPERWVQFYEDGIDGVAALDPYAGLLASLHGAGLREQRYGLADMPPGDNPHYQAFVEREHERQRDLAGELADRLSPADRDLLSTLHETGSAGDTDDSRLWRNYTLLQTWDTLSLAVCATLAPGEETTLVGEPAMADGQTVAAVDETTFRLSPYPFETEPLTVDVPARTIHGEPATTDAGLFEQYYASSRETLTLTLRSA